MTEKQKLTRADLNQMATGVMAGLVCSCEISCRHFTYDGVCAACGIRMAGDFSSDPAASKRLREKMRADGWTCILIGTPGPNYPRYTFVAGMDGRGEFSWQSDTEELAVLFSALRAVGAISGEVEVTD